MSANFNKFVDYFGLESNALKLISSDSGRACSIADVCHYGPIDAFESFSTPIYNPVCVYEVVANLTFSINLGAMAVTGYNAMITAAEIRTAAGQTPTITVHGTANEGAAAINKFVVSCAVSKRHRTQNLMWAATSIANCTSATAKFTCDPVVPYEAGLPCASDVVKGRATVTFDNYGAGVGVSSGWYILESPTRGVENGYRTTPKTFWKPLSLAS